MRKNADYFIRPESTAVRLSVAFLALSTVLRIIWCFVWPENVAGMLLYTRGILPAVACVLFIISLIICGNGALWTSFFPALLGVLFFIMKAADFEPLHQILCTILYLAVAVMYGLAVFGLAPIKKLLIPLFGLPLLYHIVVQDIIQNLTKYSAAQWFQEISVLCIMAALFCIALAMKDAKKKAA